MSVLDFASAALFWSEGDAKVSDATDLALGPYFCVPASIENAQIALLVF